VPVALSPSCRRLDVDAYKRTVKKWMIMMSQVGAVGRVFWLGMRVLWSKFDWSSGQSTTPLNHPTRAQGLPSTTGFLCGFILGLRMF